MRKQAYGVKLSGEGRPRLEDVIRNGKSSAKVRLKARILLHADTGKQGPAWNDVHIAEALGTYLVICARVRRQWAEEGTDAVLSRKKRAPPPTPRIFDGEKEAKLIALACSPPPAGRPGWTLRLLESKVVELKIVDRAGDNTIGRVLKINELKPHLKAQWVIPPAQNRAFGSSDRR
ncbi:MAG: helix-turn-helix domain-containing protein, partial [Candidatus Acidiferrum sp.]